MHEVCLAQADATVEEERIVRLRGAFRDCFRGSARELVARAGDEAVKVVARIELRRGVPVKTCLLTVTYRRSRAQSGLSRRAGSVRGRGGKAAILAGFAGTLRNGGIVLEGDELYVVELELELVDGLLNQIAVPIADMLEVSGRNAHEESPAIEMAHPRGLEEGIEGLPIDLFFQRTEDACPWVDDGRAGWNKRHTLPSTDV